MGFHDIKRVSGRMGFKSKSPGIWNDGKLREGFSDGVGKCGHYDVELDYSGYCRDEECRRERLIKALHTGEAMKMADGTIFWTPGVVIRNVKNNKG